MAQRAIADIVEIKSVVIYNKRPIALNEDWAVSSGVPKVLLSTSGIYRMSAELTVNLPGYNNHPVLNYAGSIDTTIFFIGRQTDLITKLYKFTKEGQLETFHTVAVTESSRATFLHRQPYYILKTGLMFHDYRLHSFDGKPPIDIDLAGEPLENCQRVFHRCNLLLLREEKEAKIIRRSKNVIVISDPQLDANCKVHTGDHLDFVYITNHSMLFVFNTAELSMKKVQLTDPYEIRCVVNNVIILAKKLDSMHYYEMDAQYWKTRSSLLSEVDEIEKKLKEVEKTIQPTIAQLNAEKLQLNAEKLKLNAEITREKTKSTAQTREIEQLNRLIVQERAAAKEVLDVEKASSNSLRSLNEQCTATIDKRDKKIKGLLKEISELTDEKNRQIREVREAAAREKQEADAKNREQWKEIVKLRLQHSQSISAEVERQGEERKRAEKGTGKAQLEKKYRRMLLMFARPGMANRIDNLFNKDLNRNEDPTLIEEYFSVDENTNDQEDGENRQIQATRAPLNRRYNRKNAPKFGNVREEPNLQLTGPEQKNKDTNSTGARRGQEVRNGVNRGAKEKENGRNEKNKQNHNGKGVGKGVREFKGKTYANINR